MIVIGMKEGCCKIFIDYFEIMYRLVAHKLEWDQVTWRATSQVTKERLYFAAGLGEALVLSDLSKIDKE